MRSPLYSVLGSIGTLIALLVLPEIAYAVPRSHALLVGVSSYPSLGERYQLTGPANDVVLFQRLLLERGFERANLEVLADGVPGAALPSRAAIMGALNSLAAEVRSGDLVFVLLAGHGSQQPAPAGSREPDGLDEIFLPRDVGRWLRQPRVVENAITDDEIGAALARVRARGAFVWAVFDTCHAGTLAREVSWAQQRHVVPSALGIDADAMAAARARATGNSAARSLAAPGARAESAGAGDHVYMYAAQSHELTPELLLPPQTADAQIHGLFSYTLHRVLSSSADISYRQALDRVLQLYLADGRHSPAPFYEGSALDAAVFGSSLAPRVAQWPVERQGALLQLRAGALQGIGAESIVALIAPTTAANERIQNYTIQGYMRVVSVTAGTATLTPIAYAGQPAIAAERVMAGTYARVVDMRVDFRVRLGVSSAGAFCEDPRPLLRQAVDILRREPRLGQRILWSTPDQAADLYLCQTADRVLFLDASASTAGSRAPPNKPSSKPSSKPGIAPSIHVTPEDFAAELRERIARAARVINLSRIVAANRSSAELDVTLELRRGCASSERCNSPALRLVPASRPELRDGDLLTVELENRRFQPVDVTLLYIDAAFGIELLYPRADETSRLGPKERQRFNVDIHGSPSGFERLLVLAVPVTQLGPVTSFAGLAQDGLATYGVRGARDPLLELLYEAAFATDAVSTARAASLLHEDGSGVGITTYGWTVLPKD